MIISSVVKRTPKDVIYCRVAVGDLNDGAGRKRFKPYHQQVLLAATVVFVCCVDNYYKREWSVKFCDTIYGDESLNIQFVNSGEPELEPCGTPFCL